MIYMRQDTKHISRQAALRKHPQELNYPQLKFNVFIMSRTMSAIFESSIKLESEFTGH